MTRHRDCAVTALAVAVTGALIAAPVAYPGGEQVSRLEGQLLRGPEKRPAIRAVEPDRRVNKQAVPTDPRYAEQWHYRTGGINAEGAWARGLDGTGVTIGIVDTGGLMHEDLPMPAGGYDFLSDAELARDGDGRDPDPTDEGDWSDKYDSSWHGTHVAGTIAALTNNGTGVAGVAPGATVEHLRVLGSDGDRFARATVEDVTDAIVWAAGGEVDGVATRNAPLDILVIGVRRIGRLGPCDEAYQDAIDFATASGTIVVVAADERGNDASQYTPASCDGVITVAGTAPGNTHSVYTSVGDMVEVAAPAGNGNFEPDEGQILSTMDSGLETAAEDTYGWRSGNTMAAAHVGGTIALMLQQDPALDRDEIVTILQNTGYASNGFVQGCDTDERFCRSLIDASLAVAVVAGDESLPPTPPAPPQPAAQALENGVLVDVPDILIHESLYFTIGVPDDATALAVDLTPGAGADGDAELYVRHLRAPTDDHYDCRSDAWAVSEERCVIQNPAAGVYYVRIAGTTAYMTGGYSLLASHDGSDAGGPGALAATHVFALKNHRTRVLLDWSGGAGDVDIVFDGAVVATVANTGRFTHTFRIAGTGTVAYRVCDAGTSDCSPAIVVGYASRS